MRRSQAGNVVRCVPPVDAGGPPSHHSAHALSSALLGYELAGEIPFYARNAFADRYDATRIMYKDLRGG